MSEKRGPYWFMVKVDFSEPSLEAEFNRWYDEVHVPELLQLPGFVRAWRLQRTDEGSSLGDPGQTYIAVYEVEHPKVFDHPRFPQASWDVKWGPYIKNWARTWYRVTLDAE